MKHHCFGQKVGTLLRAGRSLISNQIHPPESETGPEIQDFSCLDNKFQMGQHIWKSAIHKREVELPSLESHEVCASGKKTN